MSHMHIGFSAFSYYKMKYLIIGISLLCSSNVDSLQFGQWKDYISAFSGMDLTKEEPVMPEITTDLGRVMVEYEVIPQVISSQPQETCEVIFPPNDLKINPGDMIYNSSVIKLQPSVNWTCNVKKNYTLLFHNLDGKKRMTPLDSWIVVNIPQCNLSQGETVCPYHEPVLRDGRNRFVFLIYEQSARINYFFLMWGDIHVKRAFKPHQFAYTHFLEGPVAANFFYIENKEIYPFWEDVFGETYPYPLEMEKPTTRAII